MIKTAFYHWLRYPIYPTIFDAGTKVAIVGANKQYDWNVAISEILLMTLETGKWKCKLTVCPFFVF